MHVGHFFVQRNNKLTGHMDANQSLWRRKNCFVWVIPCLVTHTHVFVCGAFDVMYLWTLNAINWHNLNTSKAKEM